jgi:hypothetical protein
VSAALVGPSHPCAFGLKAHTRIADADDHALASRILTSAAAYEEALRSAPSVHDGGTQTVEQRALERAQATTMYFRSRMVAASKRSYYQLRLSDGDCAGLEGRKHQRRPVYAPEDHE